MVESIIKQERINYLMEKYQISLADVKLYDKLVKVLMTEYGFAGVFLSPSEVVKTATVKDGRVVLRVNGKLISFLL